MAASRRDTSTICLFDVDGTLTPSRQLIRPHVEEFLQELKKKVLVGLVGGSDFVKIAEQMGDHSDILNRFDYVFAENGLVAYKGNVQVGQQNLKKYVGDEILQKLINFALRYMSELILPCKRGTFIEFRSSMINICPVGRSCSQEERDAFVVFDEEHKIRDKFVEALRAAFPNEGLVFAIGGQISIDVFPEGWDKRYCLQFLEKDNIKNIHFFGDKVEKGGNDHEIYEDPRTIGHKVVNPDDTMQQLRDLFF
ncbi:phosphomannomutase 1-like [Biomphalaria glabrata]|uniref:Phosphomannomutase n=2 Tax=Biomphalaria TaxID=6525 RepID=A0A9W2ZR78_BIOGL|nr:phosphomannomutase 1-like [Biomphalaria glabrata]KAK0058059.1 phosphomannomutase 1 [Biomphalaria pfeifferi]